MIAKKEEKETCLQGTVVQYSYSVNLFLWCDLSTYETLHANKFQQQLS